MRFLRSRASIVDWIPEPVRIFVARRSAEIGGLALIVAAVVCALALATWSALDPSWNHATTGRIRNLLGSPGAIAADFAMQLLGVASFVALPPLVAWALSLLRARRLPFWRSRLALALGAVLACSAVAGALPRTDRWPLPTGLGGAVGDGLLALAAFVVGQGIGSALAAVTFAAVAILSFTAACGFGPFAAADERPPEEEPAPAWRDEDHRDAEPGYAIVWTGAAIHGLLSLKGAIGRMLKRHLRPEPALAWQGAGAAPAPRFERSDPTPARRAEPRFDAPARVASAPQADDAGSQPRPGAARRAEPAIAGEHDNSALAAPPSAVRLTPPAEPAPSRVTIPASTIKPGRRGSREAQPSMLDVEPAYAFPPLAMLAEPKRSAVQTVSEDALEQNARLLEGVLEDFGVRGEIVNVRPGPVVTLYELEPAPGTKSSRVISLADDIARSMSAVSARVAVIQGKNAIGIELPNQKRETVFLRELLASQDYETTKLKLPLCLGKTIGGEPVIAELARMPHLLVAGTTGSGKSVAINTMILSLLYRLKPEECRLIMVDPKMLELSVYEGIPHLLTPVVTDPKKAVVALKWAVREMEDRYRKMSKLGVRNIDGYNQRAREALASGEQVNRTVQTGYDRSTGRAIEEEQAMDLAPLPYIVVIVDEMADLMMVAGKEIEGAIQRLAQMARAAGIHVVLATQRPSVDVITGTIKANFPTRISFQVTSKIDSRTILGEQGAEQLLGQGDMLYMAGGGRITRVHGPFVSDGEVEKVVAHLKMQGRPEYLEDVLAEDGDAEDGEDADEPVFDQGEFGAPSGDVYDQAIAVVLRDRKASTSYIQRRLQIGYNRAASLMERMEKEGIVGPANHAGKREILIEAKERPEAAE